MAKVHLSDGFKPLDEGCYDFIIRAVTYDENFGKLSVKLVTDTGEAHIERFRLLTKEGKSNDAGLGYFSDLAKAATGNFENRDIDPEELVGLRVRADITHSTIESTKEPGKFTTFANIANPRPIEMASDSAAEEDDDDLGFGDLTDE